MTGKKILLVDDNEEQLKKTANMLESEFEILTVKSGSEALKHLYSSKSAPNLILLNVITCEDGRWDIYHRIKAISFIQNIPFAFIISTREAINNEWIFRMGASEFISRPFEKTLFLNRVKGIMEKYEKEKSYSVYGNR